MDLEERFILLVSDSATRTEQLKISTSPPWALVLSWGDVELASDGNDSFECLTNLRLELESKSWQICCAGARIDVYPSGMSRQMSAGRKAYVHSPDPSAGGNYLIDIFDASHRSICGTVAEQRFATEHRNG